MFSLPNSEKYHEEHSHWKQKMQNIFLSLRQKDVEKFMLAIFLFFFFCNCQFLNHEMILSIISEPQGFFLFGMLIIRRGGEILSLRFIRDVVAVVATQRSGRNLSLVACVGQTGSPFPFTFAALLREGSLLLFSLLVTFISGIVSFTSP